MGVHTNPDSFPVLSFKSDGWKHWWQNAHTGTTNFYRVRLDNIMAF